MPIVFTTSLGSIGTASVSTWRSETAGGAEPGEFSAADGGDEFRAGGCRLYEHQIGAAAFRQGAPVIEAERTRGLSPREAITEACILRFRPITMTTLAALLGGLPLALGTGPGAELRWPLGIAIVGGLIVSQMLTLFTTPVVYLYLDSLVHWLGLRRSASAEEARQGLLVSASPMIPASTAVTTT